MNNPDCIECFTHLIQWSDLSDENEYLKEALRKADSKSNRLRRKIIRLQRRIELADQLLEQQDVLLTALVQN